MALKEGGRDGPAPGLRTCEEGRPTWLPSNDDEIPWLIRSCCKRSFTELPERVLSDPCERASLGLAEDESEG